MRRLSAGVEFFRGTPSNASASADNTVLASSACQNTTGNGVDIEQMRAHIGCWSSRTTPPAAADRCSIRAMAVVDRGDGSNMTARLCQAVVPRRRTAIVSPPRAAAAMCRERLKAARRSSMIERLNGTSRRPKGNGARRRRPCAGCRMAKITRKIRRGAAARVARRISSNVSKRRRS